MTIRVLQMIGTLGIGGSQSFVMNLYRNIDRNNIQFDFIVDHPNLDYYVNEIESLGGKVYYFPTFTGSNIVQVIKVWNQFFKEHPEYKIMHSHVRSYASIYIPIAKKYGLKTIIHSHSLSNGSGIKAMIKNILQLPLRYEADYFFSCSLEAGKWLFGKKVCMTDKFKIVFGMLPNNNFLIGKRGKAGAKFKGYWFLDSANKKIFKVDYYKKMPIAICRAIRINNQVYGESSGTLALCSIKMLNHITGNTIDNIEKITDAPLGVLSGSLVAGNVINRSAASVTEFNAQAIGNNQTPIFPISQAGDISAVINFLIPELKKNITNIFKIDQLLDFNNQTKMTATESAYRMSIRGKSINGLLSQQKAELIEPVCHRSIQIIQDCGLYGYKLSELPESTPEEIMFKKKVIEDDDYIPEVIENAMKDNKIWYTLKFNGELEKLCNAEIYEAIGRFLQYLNALLAIKPDLVNAINDYEFLDLLKSVSNLVNDKLIKSKYQYNEIIKKIEELKQKQIEQQNQLQQGQYLKDTANASKDMATAQMTMGV